MSRQNNPYTRAEAINKFDPHFKKIIDGSRVTFGELNKDQPIPNHLLPSSKNFSGKDRTIYFTNNSYKTLREIKNLYLKINDKTIVPAIDFLSMGYIDNEGDIIIERIACPFLDNGYRDQSLRSNKHLLNAKKESHAAAIVALNNYLSGELIHHGEAKGLVALLGTTKQANDTITSNCITLGEIAESILKPGISIKCDNVLSGVLATTPDICEYNSNSRTYAQTLRSGSLECVTVSYGKTKSGIVANGVRNITKAETTKQNGKLAPVLISSSWQPMQLSSSVSERLF